MKVIKINVSGCGVIAPAGFKSQFSIEGDRVSYMFCIFTRREKLHVNWFDQRSLFHELSSMQFFTEGVLHILHFHIERMYEQLYHCSFSIPSYSFKKKKKSLSQFFFSFFCWVFFLLFLTPHLDEILFIYFIYNSTLCWHVLVLVINYYIIYL